MSIIKLNDKLTGREWLVRRVKKGDGYGRVREDGEFALIHDKDEPLVEFYDATYKHPPFNAQFVSRYQLSTIMEIDGTGINLDGGVENWSVDAELVKAVQHLFG